MVERRFLRKSIKTFKKQLFLLSTKEVGPPNFLIVGGAKCGTTSLYEYLSSHPQVVMSYGKEIGYFTEKLDKYPQHKIYNSYFRMRRFASHDQIKAVGEVTPDYFAYKALQRIHDFNPKMKLVYIIRDPIRRAVSQYYMYKNRSTSLKAVKEPRTMEDAFFDGEDHMAYLSRGEYVIHIRNMYTLFPREQVLILRLEDLSKDPETTLQKLTFFLGIEIFNKVPRKKHRQGFYEFGLPRELEKKLCEHFKDLNQALTNEFGIITDDWICM